MIHLYGSSVKVALINGEKVAYDVCSQGRKAYKDTKTDYLGKGTIYSVDGVLQTVTGEKAIYHFFKIT